MPVWFENDAPSTISRSDSFISQLATGVPLRPSTPAPSGWWSEIRPLALNVVRTGAWSASASSRTASISKRTPWPTTMTGRRAPSMSRSASSSAAAGGAMWSSPIRPTGEEAVGASPTTSSCTSSGSTRCATSRSTVAVFNASVISSAWSDCGRTVLE